MLSAKIFTRSCKREDVDRKVNVLPFGWRLHAKAYFLTGGEQEGKKVLDTILLAWPLVALAPGLK